MNDPSGILIATHPAPSFVVHGSNVPHPSRLRSVNDSMIPIGRGSLDSEDGRASAQLTSAETPCGHSTPSSLDISVMCGQTNDKREMSEYKREGGGSNRGLADAHDGPLILILHTYYYLCVLDLKGKKIANGRYEPVLLQKINLNEEGYPLHMGLVKLEKDRAYLFGGFVEAYRKEYMGSRMKRYEPFLHEIQHGSWSLKVNEKLPSTKAPKAFPFVANVDSKILVVEGWNGLKRIAQPFLEYYDLISKTWNEFSEIKTPQNCSEEEEARMRMGHHSGVLLVGCKLYLMFDGFKGPVFICLNTRTDTWEDESANNMCAFFKNHNVFFPNEGTCVSSVAGLDDDKHIILHHTRMSITAYLIDDCGSVLSYQDLTKELCRDIIPDHEQYMVFVDPKWGGTICMILIQHHGLGVTSGSAAMNSIHIRHFELKFNRESSDGGQVMMGASFVNVQILDDQLCTSHGIGCGELGLLHGVLL